MTITYTILTGSKDTEGSIKYWVRHSEVPSAYILKRAEAAIYQQLRVREMVTKTDGTIALDATTLAMPSDIIEPIALFRRGSYRGAIHILDQEHFEQRIGEEEDGTLYAGTPSFCTFDKSYFYFDVKADDAYLYRLWYVQTPAALSGANESNFLTDRYSQILEAMCKSYGYAHRENDRAARDEMEKAMAFITKANEEFDMFKQSIRTEHYWSR